MQIQEPNQSDTTKETENLFSKKECCGIYGLKNKITGKWYVGQSFDIQTRWYRSYEKLHCKKQRKLYNALVKYGYDSFDKIVLEECVPDVNVLNDREDYWIKYYNSIEQGYNIRAAGSKGKHSPETIEKMRIASTGKHPTDETLQKMSAWQKGKSLTEEHKLKLSLSQKGKKRTPMTRETKEKLAESIRLSWIKRREKKVEITPSVV